MTEVREGGFYAKIITDSKTIFNNRLTTMEVRYPRFIHSEILTHRDRARNSASSRAIPWPKMMERIENEPVIPIRFGSEQKGMQTGGEINDVETARKVWLEARNDAVKHAKKLADLGVHKSICNRLTEPFMWITVVMTATHWQNLFRLRVHEDAEIHFQKIAGMMKDALSASEPKVVEFGNWHLPYVDMDTIRDVNGAGYNKRYALAEISTARCARVSYLTHDGKRDFRKDLELFETLCSGSGFGHWSPHEHPATPATPDVRSGPYRGWLQFRKFFQNECALEH